MDELLTSLGIDKDSDLKSILEALEEKQFEYLERLETVSDENRKKELTEVLQCMDEAIANVKEQLKDVSSSLILDTAEPGAPVTKGPDGAKKEEKAETKKTSGKEYADQVKRMKEKSSVERKQEPAVAPEKAQENVSEKASEKDKSEKEQSVRTPEKTEKAEKTTGSEAESGVSAKKHTVSSPSAPAKEVSSDSIAFLNGLVEFKKQNYEECFKIVKELGEKEDSSAQYLLALMYLDGLGVQRDADRSTFWMRKSAQAGETAAQFMYGSILVDKSGGDQKKLKEGFRFLLLAAEKNDLDAQRKYVDETLRHPENKKRIKKAIVLCDKLKLAADDSFNKKEMDDKKQKLRAKKKMKSPKKKKKIFGWIFLLLLLAGVGLGIRYKEEIKEYISKYLEGEEPVEEEPQVEPVEVEEPEDPEEVEEEEVVAEKKVRMTATNGNIRSGASTNFESLTKKPHGTELVWTGKEELEPNGGGIWYEVKLEDGTIGWVHESIIEFIE